MFQFTREFIINDNIGKLKPNKTKFAIKDDTLLIDNMVNIRKKDVNAIYKHPFEQAVEETATFTVTAPVAADLGKVYRLVITLGQEGKVTATYNDQFPDHSRHFFYEAIAETTSASDLIDALISSFKHEATLSDVKFLDIEKSSGSLKVSALDCYTRIKEVRLVKLPQPTGSVKVGAVLTGYEDYEVVFDWKRKDGVKDACSAFTAGKEGNGNTVQILKNMRLQTWANIDPNGLQMDERPLPKGQYDQYTVELVTERRHIGHDVMGSIGTSLTTLVFYVLKNATCAEQDVSSDFEAALAELCAVEEIKKISEAADAAEAEKEATPKRALAHTKDLPAEEEGSGASSK